MAHKLSKSKKWIAVGLNEKSLPKVLADLKKQGYSGLMVEQDMCGWYNVHYKEYGGK